MIQLKLNIEDMKEHPASLSRKTQRSFYPYQRRLRAEMYLIGLNFEDKY
jgi:hypothetical protein